MVDILIIISIIIENSLAVNFPYNFIALPYLTNLAYRKEKKGILKFLIICILISSKRDIVIEISIILGIVLLGSYFLSGILRYEKINSFYYTLGQLTVYGVYLYFKIPYFSGYNFLFMALGYLLFNYLFIRHLRKKI